MCTKFCSSSTILHSTDRRTAIYTCWSFWRIFRFVTYRMINPIYPHRSKSNIYLNSKKSPSWYRRNITSISFSCMYTWDTKNIPVGIRGKKDFFKRPNWVFGVKKWAFIYYFILRTIWTIFCYIEGFIFVESIKIQILSLFLRKQFAENI